MSISTRDLTQANYLSPLEQEVVAETNRARKNPNAYAAKLENLQQYFEGNLLKLPGEIPLITQEGMSAVEEAIRFLRSARPLSPLTPSRGLSMGARDHVNDQGAKGSVGHYGSDRSNPSTRVNRYGIGSAGENISYGPTTAQDIVMQLIIDDGVVNRGHRQNIFNLDYQFTGVACGPHTRYGAMCAIAYSIAYIEKEGISVPPCASSPALLSLQLKRTLGKQQRYYELSATDKLLIGRSHDCQIVLEDYPMVSRHHAEIQPKFHLNSLIWLICDLNSNNGTHINGQRLRGCHTLQMGDRIMLGAPNTSTSEFNPEFVFEYRKFP